MGNCLGKRPTPQKARSSRWAWRRAGGKNGGKVDDRAVNEITGNNATTQDEIKAICAAVTVGRMGHVANAEGTPVDDPIPMSSGSKDAMEVVSVYDEPTMEAAVEDSVSETVDTASEDISTDVSVEDSVSETVDTASDISTDVSVEDSVSESVDTASDINTDVSVEDSVSETVDTASDISTDVSVEDSVSETVDTASDISTDVSVEDSVSETVDTASDISTDVSVDDKTTVEGLSVVSEDGQSWNAASSDLIIPRLAIPGGAGDSRADSKSEKSDDSYGNFFKLALSELDARDKAAGWDANAPTIPLPDNIDLGNKLGDGAFGTVFEATDRRSGQTVAVKEINGAFCTGNIAQKAYQEMFYMWQFGCHENILGLLGVYETAGSSVWLVTEMMEADLLTVINRHVLDDGAKRFIAYQICSAARFLHSGNVIHRDFKPENVLWNSNNLVKICDFGMARSVSDVGKDNVPSDKQQMTPGIGTIWHQAPEVLMEAPSYTTAADVWSIGSTLVELLTGVIMAEGDDKFEQLMLIFVCLPMPTMHDIVSLNSPFTTRAMDIADQTAGIDRTQCGLEEVLMRRCHPDAIDLCRRMLAINPNRRCTMEDALNHPYLEVHRDPVNEITMSDELVPPLSDWKVYTVDEYRAKAAEIMNDLMK